MMLDRFIRPPDHLRKIHVLVVDNDAQILMLMVHVLKHLGFSNVLEARDGFEAVHLMRNHKIDLVFTDWELKPVGKHDKLTMPSNAVIRSDIWSPVTPTNGANFVKYIRVSKYSPNCYVTIIMLTGMALRDHVEYARDCGVNEILIKPLIIESLCERIVSAIDKPRPFITSSNYRGPCRRRVNAPYQGGDRRKYNIRLYRHAG